MRAGLILAAGFGTRLRPYTEYVPKPLLPVAGIEPLFFALWRAKCLGAKAFYVNAHYHHEQIEHFLKKVAEPVLGIKTKLLIENPILGTGGAIRNLLASSQSRDFDELIVINGDTLLGLEKNADINQQDNSWCLVTEDQSFLKKYKPMWVDAGGFYAGVGDLENPDCGWQPTHFLGLHALNSEALNVLRKRSSPVVEEDLFRGIYRPLLDAGLEIKALNHQLLPSEFWYDMTNKEYLLEAQHELIGTVGNKNSSWNKALEARWRQEAKLMGKSWLFGFDPGCVNWDSSQSSIVVSPRNLRCQGTLGLNSSVLILDDQSGAMGKATVKNSLLMSANASPKHSIRADLENEIIFL